MQNLLSYERLLPESVREEKTLLQIAYASLDLGYIEHNGAILPTNDSVNWFDDLSKGRSFLFHLHAWDPLDCFFIAFEIENSQKFINIILNITLDWCKKFNSLDTKSISEKHNSIEDMIWYDMAVGLRVYRLAYIIDYLEQNNVELKSLGDKSSILEIYKNSIQLHFSYLEDDKNFKLNNHGIYQAFGQMAAGNRLVKYNISKSQSMYTQGQQRFNDLLDEQFTNEDIHVENSPFYNAAICDVLTQVNSIGLIKDSNFNSRINNIKKNLGWFITPSQYFVNFGDTDETKLEKYLDQVPNFSSDSLVLTKTFSETGYWIVKNKGEQGEGYLALNSAFHSRTHKHADDSSFVWHQNGRKILLDSGRYGFKGRITSKDRLWYDGYWYSDPSRIYVERTRAHNTIEVDNTNLPRVGIKPYGSGIISYGSEKVKVLDKKENDINYNQKVYYCECSIPSIMQSKTNILSKLRYPFKLLTEQFRIIIYLPDQWLLCIDIAEKNKPFNVKQWFNFDPRFKLMFQDLNRAFLKDCENNELVQIESLIQDIQIIETGRGWDGPIKQDPMYPELLGWHSDIKDSFNPNRTIAMGDKDDKKIWHFATLLSMREITVEYNSTHISTDGAIGKFQFTVNKNNFIVEYNRKKKQGLNIDVTLC